MTKMFVLGFLVVLLSGCSLLPGKSTPSTASPSSDGSATSETTPQLDVVVTSDQNGKTVTVRKDQLLGIRLASNRASGFRWALKTKPDAEILDYLSTKYFVEESKADSAEIPSGFEVGAFKALKAGTTELKLEYVDASDDTKPATKKFSLTVVVK